MTVHNKRYQASYYQITQLFDSVEIANSTKNFLAKEYGGIEKISDLSEDEQLLAYAKVIQHIADMYSDNSVWFMITEYQGRYGIVLYYDNRKNQANGDDL